MFTPPKSTKNKNGKAFVKNGFSGEYLANSPDQAPPSTPKTVEHKLFGIMSLGQTIEFGKPESNPSPNFFVNSESYLPKEENILLSHQQKELKEAIKALRQEIEKLIKSSQGLGQQVENVVEQNIPEVNEYQLSFLERIKTFILNFRKNISEASCWLESFSVKKKKKNAFWNRAKNQKSGGQQYMFSGEHSASRSAS